LALLCSLHGETIFDVELAQIVGLGKLQETEMVQSTRSNPVASHKTEL
jgi:hypothetical protein